jgi:hypothetical protein
MEEVPVEVANVSDDRVALDDDYLANRLTEAEQAAFARDGYLLVENVLAPEHLAALQA